MDDNPWVGSANHPSIWPLPQNMSLNEEYFELDSTSFQFITKGVTNQTNCDILAQGVERYRIYTFLHDCSLIGRFFCANLTKSAGQQTPPPANCPFCEQEKNTDRYQGQLSKLTITVRAKCETYSSPLSDEMYTLRINTDDCPGEAELFANSVWAALYGLETFSQLVYQCRGGMFRVNSTYIIDFPRFKHRGLLMDTSRHYIPISVIYENLEAMSYNKMNVFHWHIVDDQSFPFVSTTFPELSAKGAYYPTHVYTVNDIKCIIEFARVRGIRVIPEFNSPSHTFSYGRSHPELLTTCYNTSTGEPQPPCVPFNPTRESNYHFMFKLFRDVLVSFPQKYIQVGGNQVDYACWSSNPIIRQFMIRLNFGNNFNQLLAYYMSRILDIVVELNGTSIVYEDVFDVGTTLTPGTIVDVWKKGLNAIGWIQEMSRVTAAGHQVILSAPWTLNDVNPGPDWVPFYLFDPQSFPGTPAQKALVLGGKASLWGQYIDSSNFIPIAWPRAIAVAESLWSSVKVSDMVAALPRFEVQRCRMQQRGIHVQPVDGPGACLCDYKI